MYTNLEETKEGDGGESQCEDATPNHKKYENETEADGISKIKERIHGIEVKKRNME
jgi:hypothetical protein